MTLQETLTQEHRTKWLDINSGSELSHGFIELDTTHSKKSTDERIIQAEIAGMTDDEVAKLGEWDLIRIQYPYNNYTAKEADKIIEKCFVLLKTGGVLLVTVPSSHVLIQIYALEKSGQFDSVRSLPETDELASVPFTHTSHFRKDEDSCVIAYSK